MPIENNIQTKGSVQPKVYSIVFKNKFFGDYETRFVLAYSDQEAMSIAVNNIDITNYDIVTFGVILFETIINQLEQSIPKNPQMPSLPQQHMPSPFKPPPEKKVQEVKPTEINIVPGGPSIAPGEDFKNKIMNQIVDGKDKKLLEDMKPHLEPWEYGYLKEKIFTPKKTIKKKSKK